MTSGLGQLAADAEYSVRHLGFARLRRGEYMAHRSEGGEPAVCCLAGAAALLYCPEREVYDANWGDERLSAKLRARYGLTYNHLDGVVDGFDGKPNMPRTPETLASPDYQAGLDAGREFAERMSSFFV
jgi:hypothetical protein